MTPHNIPMELIFSLLLSLNALGANHRSVPVYLAPNNPAATGHFKHSELKKSARAYRQYEWLWVRDSFGHEGWVLKSSVMLPLDYSRRAILSKGEVIFEKPRAAGLPIKRMQDNQIVGIIKRQGDWYKIVFVHNEKNAAGWVKAKHLQPYSKDPGLFYSMASTWLKQKPQIKTRRLVKVEPGIPLRPIKIKGNWTLVQLGKKKGWIELKHLKSRIDVAMKVRTKEGYYQPHPSLIKKSIVEIFSNPLWVGTGAYTVELKSKPDMGSNTVTTVKKWQSLTLQGFSVKRWGKSYVRRWGELWWPDQTLESNIEIIENFKPKTTLLSRGEIYQVERSPSIDGLRFASTLRGVFRSFDGKNWHPLPAFKNGYPIKISKNGIVFVGDKVSFDHGESFQEYIRWDKILTAIPIERRLGHAPIQILNVEPSRKNSKHVTLSVKLGNDRIVQVYTANLGKSWQML